MEEPARLLPSGFGVDESGWAVPPDGGEIESGQLLAPGPAHEVPGLAAPGGSIAGQPLLEVTLPGGAEGELAGGQPAQQRDRGPAVLLHHDGPAVRGMPAVVTAAKPAHQVPDGVTMQDWLLAVAGDGDRDPAFETGQVLIARRQRTGGDQDRAQVLDRLAHR